MVKKLKNSNKIKMNDGYNQSLNYLILFEFCFQLGLKNKLDDNRENHHDFLESAMMSRG